MRNLLVPKLQVKHLERTWKINGLKIASYWTQQPCKKKAMTRSSKPKCPQKDYRVMIQQRFHNATTFNYLSDYTDQLMAVNLDTRGDLLFNNKQGPDLAKPNGHLQGKPNLDNNYNYLRRDLRAKWVRWNPITVSATTNFDSSTSSLERTQEVV